MSAEHAPLPPVGDPEWENRREMAKVFAELRNHSGDEGQRMCKRCLCCDTDWTSCDQCGGEGWEDRYDEDPLWYGHDLYRCGWCNGTGGWRTCLGNCYRVADAAVLAKQARPNE